DTAWPHRGSRQCLPPNLLLRLFDKHRCSVGSPACTSAPSSSLDPRCFRCLTSRHNGWRARSALRSLRVHRNGVWWCQSSPEVSSCCPPRPSILPDTAPCSAHVKILSSRD